MRFLDREVVPWSLEEAEAWAMAGLAGEGCRAIFTLNPETWLCTRGWPAPPGAVWLPESILVAWGMRRLGLPATRAPGADLVARLLARPVRVVAWGGKPAVAAALPAAWERAGHQARLWSAHDGYTAPAAGVVAACREAAPALLLVGQGAGRQERLIADTIPRLKGAVAIGVGGTLDVLAGRRRRAPAPVRRWGLEAVWRVGLSAQRWRRLLRSHPAFVRAVLGAGR